MHTRNATKTEPQNLSQDSDINPINNAHTQHIIPLFGTVTPKVLIDIPEPKPIDPKPVEITTDDRVLSLKSEYKTISLQGLLTEKCMDGFEEPIDLSIGKRTEIK